MKQNGVLEDSSNFIIEPNITSSLPRKYYSVNTNLN